MNTIGDYYETIQEAEKTIDELNKIARNYPAGNAEREILLRAAAYIYTFVKSLKETIVKDE